MWRATRDAVGVFAEVFRPEGPILEIGSYLHHGFDHFANVRPFFSGQEYVGLDIRDGPGVDVLGDAQRLTYGDGSFGTVLSLDLLEHVRDPWSAVAETHRVLRDDGLFVLSVPCVFRLHAFPTDYWRFTASGVDSLLAGWGARTVFALGPMVRPSFAFAVASKDASPLFEERSSLFRSEITRTFSTPRSRLKGHFSVSKGLGRDVLGWMLGRARVGVAFFDADEPGGYEASARDRALAESAESSGAPPTVDTR